LIVVVFVEIVDCFLGFFDGFLFFPLSDFFSALDLKVSFFAPLSGAVSILSSQEWMYLMTCGSSCRGIGVVGKGDVAVFPNPFYPGQFSSDTETRRSA
jgi:hypothetical protein